MVDYKKPETRVAIINNITNEIMAAGLVVSYKDSPELMISIDFKHFFVTRENPLFNIKIITDDSNNVKLDTDKYKKDIYPYKAIENRNNKNELIFREFDITELDQEIAPLVYALNSAGYKTTGSCCGHGYSVAWIHVVFNSFLSLKTLLKVLESNDYKFKFVLTTNSDITSTSSNEIRLSLQTVKVGKEAYLDILDLSKYLEKHKEYFIRANTLHIL